MKNSPKVDSNFIVIAAVIFILILLLVNNKNSYKKRPSGRSPSPPWGDAQRFFGSIKR